MEEKRIALLIDIENVSAKSIKYIIDDLNQKGTICIKRVYCVAKKLAEKGIEDAVRLNNLEIKTQYDVVSGKNASDFNLVIDAMEILYSKSIDCFAIVSSDSDFTILVNKIKSENKIVIGYGEQKTNPLFRSSYNEFVFVENLLSSSSNKLELIKESQVITKDKLEKEITMMIAESENDTMQLSQINDKLTSKYSDFDIRTYGYKKFSDFICSMNSIDVSKINKDGHTYIARLKENKPTLEVKVEDKKEEVKVVKNKKKNKELELKELIIKVLHKYNNKINLAQINEIVKKEDPTFSIRNYGVSRFSKLITKYKWPEIGFDDDKKPYFVIYKGE